MANELNMRQQRAAERVLEDETLVGDLTDDSASTLVNWASEQASVLAGEASRSDDQVDAAIGTLRQTVRAVASSGETDAQKLVAQATAALDVALGKQSAPATAKGTPATAVQTALVVQGQATASAPTDSTSASWITVPAPPPLASAKATADVVSHTHKATTDVVVALPSTPAPASPKQSGRREKRRKHRKGSR